MKDIHGQLIETKKNPGFGYCIYCRKKTEPLTDEHIVPYGIGGAHVIKAASCRDCAKITAQFEGKVLGGLWREGRIAFNSPSRRRRSRQQHFHSGGLKIPVEKFPGIFVFYQMPKSGILSGLPSAADTSPLWKLVGIDDDKRTQFWHKKHPKRVKMKFSHQPLEFGQMLIKIAYCQVLSDLAPDKFEDLATPYILGKENNVSFLVGCSDDQRDPDKSIGYYLNTFFSGNSLGGLVGATVKILANTHAPTYDIIVGRITNPKDVKTFFDRADLGISARRVIFG